MAVLKLSNVSKNFGGVSAASNLDLTVEEGQIFSLIGPNGAGKTTVFNMITGVYKVTAGEILFRDKKIDGLRPFQIVSKGIARTYQNIRLFKNSTAVENVMTGFHCHTSANMFNIALQPKKMAEEERMVRAKSEKLLDYLNLSSVKDEQAKNLPYGHQRILEIARALATQPRLLLLDEPAAGMNAEEKKKLIETIRQIQKDFDLTVLLVEHDMELVMQVSDYVAVLNYGAKICEGPPACVQCDESVIEAYLGRGGTKDE